MAGDLLDLHDGHQLVVDAPAAFKCSNFADCISKRFDKLVAQVRESDLRRLKSFRARNKRIRFLEGIEAAINLQELDLGINLVADLSPLSSLTRLEKLSFPSNPVQSLSPLSSLKCLKHLNLRISSKGAKKDGEETEQIHNPRVLDLSNLSRNPQIQELIIPNNLVKDWAPIGAMKDLSVLSIGYTNGFLEDSSDMLDPKELTELIVTLENLRELHLNDQPFKPRHIKFIRGRLPDCKIYG